MSFCDSFAIRRGISTVFDTAGLNFSSFCVGSLSDLFSVKVEHFPSTIKTKRIADGSTVIIKQGGDKTEWKAEQGIHFMQILTQKFVHEQYFFCFFTLKSEGQEILNFREDVDLSGNSLEETSLTIHGHRVLTSSSQTGDNEVDIFGKSNILVETNIDETNIVRFSTGDISVVNETDKIQTDFYFIENAFSGRPLLHILSAQYGGAIYFENVADLRLRNTYGTLHNIFVYNIQRNIAFPSRCTYENAPGKFQYLSSQINRCLFQEEQIFCLDSSSSELDFSSFEVLSGSVVKFSLFFQLDPKVALNKRILRFPRPDVVNFIKSSTQETFTSHTSFEFVEDQEHLSLDLYIRNEEITESNSETSFYPPLKFLNLTCCIDREQSMSKYLYVVVCDETLTNSYF